MKKLLPFLISFCCTTLLQAQSNNAVYKLEESSNANAMERSSNIRATSDEGYIMAGTWGSGTYARATVVKMDRYHNPQWSLRTQKVMNDGFGQPQNQVSYGMDVIEVEADSYVLLASIDVDPNLNGNDATNQMDFLLVKFQSNGTIIWSKTFGEGFSDLPFKLEKTKDNGFIITGYFNRDQNLNIPSQTKAVIIKTDANGNTQWAYQHDMDCYTEGNLFIRGGMPRSVIQTQDNGYVYTFNCNENQYIVKLNSAGIQQWVKHTTTAASGSVNLPNGYGYIGAGYGGVINSIRELPNGDLAFGGNLIWYAIGLTNPDNPALGGVYSPIAFIFTTNSTGTFQKGSAFFHSTGQSDGDLTDLSLTDMYPMKNGHFMVAGNIDVYRNGAAYFNAFAMEYDINSTTPNTNTIDIQANNSAYMQMNNQYLYGFDVPHLTYNPDIPHRAVVGYDYKILHIDNLTTLTNCNHTPDIVSFPMTLNLDAPSLARQSLTVGTDFLVQENEITVTKNELCKTDVTDIASNTVNGNNLSLYPNPNTGSFIIEKPLQGNPQELIITDLQGKIIYQNNISTEKTLISIPQISAGIYFVKVGDKVQKWVKN